jgi:hypothetical protein
MTTRARIIAASTFLLALALPAIARAQDATTTTSTESASGGGTATGLGIGIQAMLAGPLGPAVVYATESFHIEGMFSFADDGGDNSDLDVGGRFYWHLHQATSADFSIGGGVGLEMLSENGPMGEEQEATNIFIEGGAEIRFFPVPNVSLSASLGVIVATGDADGFAATGQLIGGVGIAYFFSGGR